MVVEMHSSPKTSKSSLGDSWGVPIQTKGLPQSRLVHLEKAQLRVLHGPEGSSKRHLGGKHPINHDDLHDMAVILASQGRLAEAEAYFGQAWKGRSAKLGENHPMAHQSLRECAEMRRRQGDAQGAKEMLKDNHCHGFHEHHPAGGNDTLATCFSHTQITPKSYRWERGSSYPTPNPGIPLVGLEPHLKEQHLKRSFSMSAEIRKSPSAKAAGLNMMLGY
eukprot:TRINITY_DN25677_c0_g1_i1.p1 TRINITY_DN25677_c0_g1~~TRINITY_DN25677_c0_g1_i1.p1  ORF type:complete len:220 (+),score=32.94 TRINITY_DN25677_c0_g1_i1:25-684(+)